jgi:hypothetical protein
MSFGVKTRQIEQEQERSQPSLCRKSPKAAETLFIQALDIRVDPGSGRA